MKFSIVLVSSLLFLFFVWCNQCTESVKQQEQTQQPVKAIEEEKTRKGLFGGSRSSSFSSSAFSRDRKRCAICPRFPVCRCNTRRGWKCVWIPRTCYTCGYYACVRDRRRFDGGAGGQGFEVIEDRSQAKALTGTQEEEGDLQEWSDDQGQDALIEEDASLTGAEQAPLVGGPLSGQAQVGTE